MASPTNLEERFSLAVNTIQNLPPHGIIQPSNLTKLTFYGLYKQATLGPCKDSRPSMFNVVARAKWEAWDRCRSLTKEKAMLAYIDEIRKIIEAMPQTNDVLEFAKAVGISTISNDDQSATNTLNEKPPAETTVSATVNDPNTNDRDTDANVHASNENSRESSSSTSSSLVSTSSDVEEFYDDPSWFVPSNDDELISDYNILQQPSIVSPKKHSHRQKRTNSSVLVSSLPHNSNLSNERFHSISSMTSDTNHQHRSPKDFNKQTQHAILKALNKLQLNINNILERLNHLETSVYLVQQREFLASVQSNTSSRRLPLSGFRRSTVAFILLWPFVAFILMHLFRRAKISIQFRRQHLFKA